MDAVGGTASTATSTISSLLPYRLGSVRRCGFFRTHHLRIVTRLNLLPKAIGMHLNKFCSEQQDFGGVAVQGNDCSIILSFRGTLSHLALVNNRR